MKQTDLVRRLESAGCLLVRHGGKHDWYADPQAGVGQPAPRHREVSEQLAKDILRKPKEWTRMLGSVDVLWNLMLL